MGDAVNVDEVHVQALRLGHSRDRPVEHACHAAREPVGLLELCVEEEELAGVRRGGSGDGPLEKVTRTLYLPAAVARSELAEIRQPDGRGVRIREERDSLLEHSEGLLEASVLLEQGRIVEQHLRRDDAQLHRAVVHGPRRVERAKVLLQVGEQGPEGGLLEDPVPHGGRVLRGARARSRGGRRALLRLQQERGE